MRDAPPLRYGSINASGRTNAESVETTWDRTIECLKLRTCSDARPCRCQVRCEHRLVELRSGEVRARQTKQLPSREERLRLRGRSNHPSRACDNHD